MSRHNNKKLLVEGKNDEHVLYALCQRYNFPKEAFAIRSCEGVDKLLEQLPVELKSSGLETLGVIIDADEASERRWHQLKDKVKHIVNDLPDTLPNQGLIHPFGHGKWLGVWIMPDNQLNGMLEDFLAFLVPDDDLLLPAVDQFLKEAETQQIVQYAPIHLPKARIHTWLSCQKDPGTPLGQSITKHYLSLDNDLASCFQQWLENLFKVI